MILAELGSRWVRRGGGCRGGGGTTLDSEAELPSSIQKQTVVTPTQLCVDMDDYYTF